MFMRLLKQQLHAWPEEELIQESEQFLDYYMPDTKSEQMDIIQTFISDIPHPVLIVDSITEEIQYFNPAADLDVPMFGKPIGDIVQLFGKEVAQEPVAYFNGKWYSVFKTPFLWENKRHTKFELKPRTIIPDRQSLNGWKSMISVMLHRFRSPLTGVEGFLHLLEEENQDPDLIKRIESIQGGVDRLIAILDELETLYHIEENDEDQSPQSNDIQKIIYQILKNYPAHIRKKISFYQSKDNASFRGSKINVEKILEALIQNAVDNATGEEDKIFIEIHPDTFIKITNTGRVIPDEVVDRIFSPFVTTKAENLGIGLTTAMLHAEQFGGAIFLTENSASEGISFSLCFPK
ncbi:MAG TPA: hypothetical protein DEQ34_02635 [Balneolaceae bacterium]|nr:hypothetical protein [Balneolaceae bacterium]|tara:strand:- start:191728 stop:192774 length:1047 start_codon:yes stop_codon:yes gene_type:complete